MRPINEWHYTLDDYVPWIILVIMYVVLFPIRVVILLMLPTGARFQYHRLHKIRKFLEFEDART